MPYLSQTFASRSEAEFAVQALENEGIIGAVSASDAGGVVPALETISAIRIEVAPEDVERAEALIADLGFGSVREVDPPSTRERLQGWILGLGLVAVLLWFAIYAIKNPPSGGPQEVPPQAQSPW